jgi:hypothetical protein
MGNENISAFEKGLKSDIERNIMDAIHYYELSIEQNEKIKDAYINLLVIHWLIIYDYGYYERYGFNDNNYKYPENQYEKILVLGKKDFPDEMEFLFWEKYFNNLLAEKDFLEEECLQLADMDKESLLPYFFLFIETGKNEYKAKAGKLIRKISNIRTIKNEYIATVLINSLY